MKALSFDHIIAAVVTGVIVALIVKKMNKEDCLNGN